MKTKALLLGAKPSLFEGPWVSLSEAERWRARVQTNPLGVDVNECVVLEVEASPRARLPFVDGMTLKGDNVRAIIVEDFECESFSIILEAF